MRAFWLSLALLPCLASAEIHYKLEVEPAARTIRVALEVPNPGGSITARIPAWCPGFYFLLDYPSKISDFAAVDREGKPLTVTRDGKTGWKVEAGGADTAILSYRVKGNDPGLGFFGVNVMAHTAFVNGPAAFMYVEKRKEEPVALELQLPADWDVATSMRRDAEGRFVAGGYDELVDSPLQVGHFERRSFSVAGFPFEAIFVTRGEPVRQDMDASAKVLKQVSEAAIGIFGPLPEGRYTYILHLALGGFGGGLEHRASTVLSIANQDHPDLAHLAAHEFVHTWNVKQIRPRELGPFDYDDKVRSKYLWFAEGVTEFYATRVVRDAGLIDENTMLSYLTQSIRSVEQSEMRQRLSLQQACEATWDNGGFGVGDLNYYSMGAVVGLLLDAAIRAETHGQRSLDDAMRLMMKKYALPKPGFDDAGIGDAVSEVAGTDLRPMLEQMVATTQPLPYGVLRRVGLRLSNSLELEKDPDAGPAETRLREAFLAARPAPSTKPASE